MCISQNINVSSTDTYRRVKKCMPMAIYLYRERERERERGRTDGQNDLRSPVRVLPSVYPFLNIYQSPDIHEGIFRLIMN